MLSLLILLVLVLVGCHLLRSKLGVSQEDSDLMWFGVIAFGGLEILSKILAGLFTGAFAGLPVLLIMLALYSGIAYYLFNRSGL